MLATGGWPGVDGWTQYLVAEAARGSGCASAEPRWPVERRRNLRRPGDSASAEEMAADYPPGAWGPVNVSTGGRRLRRNTALFISWPAACCSFARAALRARDLTERARPRDRWRAAGARTTLRCGAARSDAQARAREAQMKASDLIAACLDREGVRHVFGVPGEEIMDILDSLHDTRVAFVRTRHEQGAAFMADAWGGSPAGPGSAWALSARARPTSPPASPMRTSTARRSSRSPVRPAATASTRSRTSTWTSSRRSARSPSGTRAWRPRR